ncbi:MAG: glycosyltransferase family 39 protein, partial [Bacteroidetes bacterium]|nr:glycosyltransferase family 39 protein [Bacteroidota bacterium]
KTGVFAGLGMLSKYTTIFIWTGIIAYVAFYDRKWLKSAWLYISVIISLIIFSPVVYWNVSNHFISLSYQGERINLLNSNLRLDYFLMELSGEFLYNNPVNVTLIIISLIAFYKNKNIFSQQRIKLIVCIGLPMIFIFILFSLFRRTLPHWTAPGYTTLLIIAAFFLREKNQGGKLIPRPIRTSGILLLSALIIGFLQVKTGLVRFTNPETTNPTELGKYDVSLEISGWKQIGTGFSKIIEREKKINKFHNDYSLISHRWFPAANLDYYAGRPNHVKTLAIGSIQEIHKYYWINQYRGGFYYGQDAYFITTSYDYADPFMIYSDFFEKIEAIDTLKIERSGKHVMNAFVYRMENMKRLPVIK